MFSALFLENFDVFFTLFSFAVSAIFGIFLFWRVARHDFVDSQTIFDIVVVSILGSLFFGRIFDFFLRPEYFEFSLRKLVFFNAFGGLDYYGSFFGAAFVIFLYCRYKRQNFWYLFDFATIGISFSLFLFNLLTFIKYKISLYAADDVFAALLFTIYYFIVYWAIRRLEKKKKHKGFFTFFFVVSFTALNLFQLIFKQDMTRIYYIFTLISMSFLLITALFVWYSISKRKIVQDVKTISGAAILSLFKIKRILTSIKEADNVAKTIVLSPLLLFKAIYNLVKYLGQELASSFIDLVKSFGILK